MKLSTKKRKKRERKFFILIPWMRGEKKNADRTFFHFLSLFEKRKKGKTSKGEGGGGEGSVVRSFSRKKRRRKRRSRFLVDAHLTEGGKKSTCREKEKGKKGCLSLPFA